MLMNLKDEIFAGESVTLEFKRCPNENAERWLKTVVAFANGRGGRILFGVDNDRTVVGLDGNLFAIRDSISDAVADACSPLIPVLLGMVTVDGKALLVLDVPQGRQCPYFIKSMGEAEGVFVRHDATTRKADEVTLQELRLAGAGRSYDQLECRGLAIDENAVSSLCNVLHEYALKNARTEAQRADVKPLTPIQLRKWGVLLSRGEREVASNAFALLAGCEPLETTTKCAVFKGKTRTVFLDRRVFGGAVQSQVEFAYRYILQKINVGARFDGLGRVETYEIPPDAIREIVVNAYVHRSYVNGAGTSVSVAIYDDRIEITSPGGLPRDVSVEKVMAGYSECRNEALVHVFAYMGLMEDWGTGLPRASEELKSAGLPNLEMTDWGNAVRVTIYRQSPSADGGKNEVAPERFGIKERIVDEMRKNAEVTTDELVAVIGGGKRSIERAISVLKEEGRIVRQGGAHGGKWLVKRSHL